MPETHAEMVKRWEDYGKKHLLDRRVTNVRYLTDEEKEHLDWHESVPVIEFDDGTLIFPSRDDEGNGGGALFGQYSTPNGSESLTLPVIRG